MNITSLVLIGLLPAAGSAASTEARPTGFRVSPTYQEEEEPVPHWSGTLSIGATLTSGNTSTFTAAADVEAVRRGEDDRLTLKAYWNKTQQKSLNELTGMLETEVTQRNIGGSAKYDYFATEKLYYFGVANVQKDDLANLDLRYAAGGGAGYQFKETEELSFSGELGLTYTDEDFEEPPPPAPSDDDDFVSLRLATVLGWQVAEDTRFEQTAEAYPAVDDFDDMYARVDSKVRVNLTENMFAQLQHVLDFDHTPATGADQTDHRLILGVGWSF